jgi:hypothetical protein
MPRKGILTLFLFEEGGEIKEKTDFPIYRGGREGRGIAAPTPELSSAPFPSPSKVFNLSS